MFSNLSKEIILYSMVPVIIIVLIDVILFFLVKKKDDHNFRFNFLIKLSMIFAIGLVLPLICGYTWWIIESFSARDILFENFNYVTLIIFLCLSLLTLVIWIYLRALDVTRDLENNELENIKA